MGWIYRCQALSPLSDLGIEYSPYEASLDLFVRMNKGDFIGKKATIVIESPLDRDNAKLRA